LLLASAALVAGSAVQRLFDLPDAARAGISGAVAGGALVLVCLLHVRQRQLRRQAERHRSELRQAFDELRADALLIRGFTPDEVARLLRLRRRWRDAADGGPPAASGHGGADRLVPPVA
jgi:hypothetical protein